METIDETAKRFLSVEGSDGCDYGSSAGDGAGDGDGGGYGCGYGSGYGNGNGYGGWNYGSGDGDGSGDGNGGGHGYGNGCGYGGDFGDGYGGGIEELNHHRVYLVDDVKTIFYSVHGNYARGARLNSDLTLTPCYIARVGNCFAHGNTLHEARRDAEAKALEDMPIEERIGRFKAEHPDLDTPYGDLFQWHHILTGSCLFGREQWCKEHGYKPTDSITVRTFIDQTKGDYGGDIIRKLAEMYGYEIG